ncbi:MAG: hypothetical protein IJ936_01470, partial [Peptococcaceae bacterium]|nr:hypothetical protein [Peptococcaceae bacterium]
MDLEIAKMAFSLVPMPNTFDLDNLYEHKNLKNLLTVRELEVLKLLIDGKTNSQIAQEIIVSTKFFCELILEQFLPSLRSRFPNIKVRLIENEYHTTPALLSVAGCKFAVLTRITANDTELMSADFLIPDEVFYDKQYQYISLFTDTFGFCTAKSSLLSSIPTIYPNTIDLTQYQATTFPFGAASLSDEIFLSSNNPQLHIDAMLNDNAFCNIPYFIYQHLFSHEEALTYRAYSSNMAISYYLIYPAEHTLTAAEQIFIKELQSYLTQMEFK